MTSSRVNVRFVAMLAVVLILLAGGVMVAGYYALKKSGDQYAALGDKYATSGNYEKAAEYYSKAVHKNQGNAEWCRKWVDALEQTTPKPRAAYFDRFERDYQAALLGLSEAAPADVAAQKKRMEVVYRRLRGSVLNNLEFAAKQAEQAYMRVPEGTPGRDTLLRYRGLAHVDMMRLVGTERPKEERQQAHDDLQAALAADPSDRQAATGLADWCLITGSKIKDAGDPAEGQRLLQEARSVLEKSAAANPPASAQQLYLLRMDLTEAASASAKPMTVGELYSANRARFLAVAEALKAEKPENLEYGVAATLMSFVRVVPDLGLPAVIEIVESLLKKKPDDPGLRMLLAYYELLSQHLDRAAQIYAEVAAMPDAKLSLAGMTLFDQRNNARRGQVMVALAEWELAKTSEAKSDAIRKAEGFRKQLADEVGESVDALLYIDAKIAFAKNDVIGARTALVKYNDNTANADNDAVMMLANLMVLQQNYGEAIKQYKLVLARDRANFTALLALGNLSGRMQDYAAAVEYLKAASEIAPGNAAVAEELARVQDLGRGSAGAVDPVMKAMLRAQELANGVNPDFEGATGVIRGALASKDDVRLHVLLVRLRMIANDRPGAKAALDTALQKYPDNTALKDLVSGVNEEDPDKALENAVNNQPGVSDLQKQLQMYVGYARLGKADKAKAALDKAIAIDAAAPEAERSTAVLDFKFQYALSQKDYDGAAKLAEEAAARDADHVQGLTFRARLNIARQKYAEGAAALEKALEADKLNMPVWRLLGTTRLAQQGQLDRAAEAFDKALSLKPDDVASMIGWIKATAAARKFSEALAFARKNQSLAGNDPEFTELWLTLESMAPNGDRAKALEARRQIAKRDPANDQNNTQLMALLVDSEQWDDAAILIEQARKTEDSLQYAQLDARMRMSRGDSAGAEKVFTDFIGATPDDKKIDAYLAESNLFATFGQTEKSIAILEQARKSQDPKRLEADRALGDMFYALGRFDEAVEKYDLAMKAAGEDPGNLILKRIVDSLNRVGKYAQARQRLDGLGGNVVEADAGLMMLRGETLAGLNERASAKAYFDHAVAMAKDDPMVYVRRAEFLSFDPQRAADAESDYRQAISMQPRMQVARERLARMLAQNARWSDAIEVIRQGVAADPENSSLRGLLVTLYVDRGQGEEAVATVRQGVDRAPDDLRWLLRAGEVMTKLGRSADAADYASRIWAKSKSPDTAMLYIDSLLRLEKPDVVKATAVLNDPSLKVDASAPLLMTRARVALKQGKGPDAGKDMAAAMAKIDPQNPGDVKTFFNGLEIVFPEAPERLAALNALKPADGWKGWFRFFAANLKSGQPATASEGLAEMKALAEGDSDPQMKRLVLSVLGTRSHSDHRADEALTYWKRALEIDPTDPDLNNNVAYTLATDMNDPEKARPYAEKAAEKMPNNAAVLDTLGTVYMSLKDMPRAENALMRAAAAAGDTERPAVLLHVGQLRVAQKNKGDAQKYVRLLEDMMSKDKRVREDYTAQVTDLKRKVEAM